MTQANHAFPNDPTEQGAEFTSLFLHKLRHDLINTVRPVVEIPKWIEEDIAEEGIDIPASLRENLDLLGTHSARLTRMIEDLLVYAHINQHPETAPASLTRILAEMIEDSIPPEFQVLTDLTCDTLPVPQPDVITLLEALISNSIKHHDQASGKIQITCRLISGVTQLYVADDGPGIVPKHIDKIFDPLTTLASRDELEGSGMGLTMVRRIALANGGQVKAISSEGKRGTCIVVWFP